MLTKITALFTSWKAKAALALVVLAVGGGTVATIKYQSNTIDRLEAEKLVLDNTNTTLRAEKELLTIEINDIQQLHKYIYAQQRISEERVAKLKQTFQENKQRQSRDIGKLAQSKPLLINKAINRGTASVFDCLEAITKGNYEEVCHSDSE